MKSLKKFFLSAVGLGFTASFIILGTMVAIIAAQGKVVTPEGSLESTSIIRVNTDTTNYEVYVNGSKTNVNNNKIEFIKPGNNTVEIKKTGTNSWTKRVSLAPNEVFDIYPQLLPSSLIPVQISDTPIAKASFSANSNYVFFVVLDSAEAENLGLWRLKLEKNVLDFGVSAPKKIATLTTELQKTLQSKHYNLIPSSDGGKVLLDIPSTEQLFLYETNGSTKAINLSEDIGFYPTKVEWFKSGNSLVVQQNTNLFEYDLNDKLMSVIYLGVSDSSSYTVGDDRVYYIRPNKESIWLYQNRTNTILSTPKNFIFPNRVESIQTLRGSQHIIFLNTSQGVILLNTSNNYFEIADKEPGRLLDIAEGGRVIAYEKEDGNIWVYKQDEKKQITDVGFSSTINTNIQTENLTNFKLVSGGRFIYWMEESQDGKLRVLTSDIDGENILTVVDESSFILPGFALANGNSELYFVANSSNEDEGLNIFSIKLD